MAAELIFITGATGFIGSTVALTALQAGFRLRISLRRPSNKIQELLSRYSSQIEYVTVLDITDEQAFTGKLEGVDYVLHLASPQPHAPYKNTSRYFYNLVPAVKGTTEILKEASKVSSIKKVVITSSIASLIPLSGIPTGGVIKEENDLDFSIDDTADFNDPTNPAGTAFKFYHASKLLANKATWEFREVEKPHFSLVSLHPGFVYGYNPTQILAKDVESTSNGILWRAIMKGVTGSRATGVHVQDVADAHIRALSPQISDGSKCLLIGQKTSWKEIAQIVHRDYPHIGAKISVDLEEDTLPVDTSKAEKELRIQWRSFERIIHDFLDQQLELIQSEQMAV